MMTVDGDQVTFHHLPMINIVTIRKRRTESRTDACLLKSNEKMGRNCWHVRTSSSTFFKFGGVIVTFLEQVSRCLGGRDETILHSGVDYYSHHQLTRSFSVPFVCRVLLDLSVEQLKIETLIETVAVGTRVLIGPEESQDLDLWLLFKKLIQTHLHS